LRRALSRSEATFYAYLALSHVALALPEPLAYGFARLAGRAAYSIARTRRTQVEKNLARITGHPIPSAELRACVQLAFEAYARYWLETFRHVRETPEFFLERFECEGLHWVDEARARGSGVIIVGAHLGNWDAAGAWAAASGRPVTAVAEVLSPRRLFDFFVAHRERLGISIEPASAGVIGRLKAAVDEGRIVAIVGDRDLRGRGPQVSFFGEPAPMPAGPALLGLRTGAPIMVMGVHGSRRADGRRGWKAQILEPIDPADYSGPNALSELTQQVARRLERLIAAHPEEWHVFQPFWSADRPSRP
jgi:phosphatidylinositol dimannoside acyltransferase